MIAPLDPATAAPRRRRQPRPDTLPPVVEPIRLLPPTFPCLAAPGQNTYHGCVGLTACRDRHHTPRCLFDRRGGRPFARGERILRLPEDQR
jgi:hypothetical protein